MNLDEFKEKALSKFTEKITDIFFCYIENDRELLQDYLGVIGGEGDLHTTNMALGKAVKARFDLENGEECTAPKCKLIKSYTTHICRRASTHSA